ncbi:MAG TPA: extracellular solute-binding protein [Chloroflexota bacterium]|nr:extracellular solute-binding protein [Chloroflexota bacterium]
MSMNLGPQNSKRLARRKLLELGTLAMGASIVAACSSGPTTSQPTSAPAPGGASQPTSVPAAASGTNTGATVKQPVTITYNTWWVPLQDVIKTFTQNFQDANPGVTVNTQFITTSYADKMSAALVAGNFGDAATGNNGIDSKWQSGGYHYDLTDYLKADNISLQKDYSLGGLELWCGKALSLPMDNDDRAIYYNKTMIKAAGAKDPWDDLHGKWTWDDMLEIAAACTKKDSSGKITQYGLMVNYDDTEEFEPFVWSLGGNYANWDTGQYNYLDPAVIKAQQLLYKWATQDKIMITKEAISNLQGASGVNPFRAGIVAMYHRASYDATLNEKEIGNKFEWDAAPFPDPGSFNPGKPGVPCSTANPQFVPKSAKYPEQGYKWLIYMCGDTAENTYAKNKTMMVAKLSAWKTYQDTQPPKHPGSFVYYVYSRPHGFHYYSDLMNEVMYSIVQPELDKAYLGQETIEQALQNAQKKIDTLGKSQSASCSSPYGQQGSPRPAYSEADLASIGVHAYTS